MKPLFTAVFGKLTFGTFFLLSVVTANAQSTASGAGHPENAATVKYEGAQDDMLVFNVSYGNPEGNKFLFTIKDQDGTQLFQRYFSEKSFNKQVKLPKSDKDKLFFIIRNGQDQLIVKTFEINVNSHFIQEVAVKKF